MDKFTQLLLFVRDLFDDEASAISCRRSLPWWRMAAVAFWRTGLMVKWMWGKLAGPVIKRLKNRLNPEVERVQR